MTAKPRKATTRAQTVRKPAAGQTGDHLEPTSAKGWKRGGVTLTLPSGNVMRLRNAGVMELAHKGLIPNGLMSFIMDSVQKGSSEISAEQMLSDSKIDVQDMFDMMANAIIMMAEEPKVYPVPEEGETRDDELLYVDEVEEEDKLFIWQWATGGTTDVEQFRRESSSMLGSMAGLQGVEPATKRASSARK